MKKKDVCIKCNKKYLYEEFIMIPNQGLLLYVCKKCFYKKDVLNYLKND